MYDRIVGSSSQFTSGNQTDDSSEAGDSPRFAQAIAGMGPAESSSEPAASYSLVSEPPIREIDQGTFNRGVERFLRDDIRQIAEHPEEYSDFVSKKAERAAMVAVGYLGTYYDPSKPARFYAYQLGDEIVGLMRAGGPARIKGDQFQQQFGRDHVTSVVDLRVTHPLVENAGDILLEHQLREDGDHPLILSRPALPGMEPRLAEMGFVHMGRNYWVLDPHQHPDVWTKNENEPWQRADKPTKYLSKAGGTDVGPQRSYDTDSSDDDGIETYLLERTFRGLHME
ncbi:host specificity protein [Bradyrhizobium sp. PMVTL-01]|uniref:host specificity protein n=1 Tax=Bradyrhizobium sp. PMVTL-01 TaxID=3434999 RepID=UPI003F70C9B6